MSNLKYWLWLAGRKGLAGQNAMRVLNHFGSPERVYYSDKEEYQLIPGLSAGALSSLEDKSLDGANRILGDCDRLGIRVLTLQDSIYPERLAAIHQPPMVLYLKGRGVSFDEEAAIAIVGTRSATPYGLWAATKLSMDLTASGALIVSGMAEGIDAAALRGALKAGGPVVSVLAGGIDVIYPRENRPLYEDVAAVGTLISEHPPGTAHIGSHFPVRNRIISGLSAGVIAIESKRFGGTMYTVSHALDQNREVFAVPGPIGAEASEGTNKLIQEGAAKLIMNAEDVICELIHQFPGRLKLGTAIDEEKERQRLSSALDASAAAREKAEKRSVEKEAAKAVDSQPDIKYIDWKECRENLSEEQQIVLSTMGDKLYRTDDLVEMTQIPARRVLSALTILQIKGYVTEENGKRFRATVRLKME